MTREFPKNNPPKIELPTVGRIVLVYDPVEDAQLAAMVAKVIFDDPMVINVGALDLNGCAKPMQHVKHASLPRHEGEPYWDWMAYQKGQARKAEELEAKLKSVSDG